MDYLLIKGHVLHLHITEGYEDLSPFEDLQSGVAVAGIAATVLEISSGPALLANSRIDTEIPMEFFTCFVGEKALKGRFYKIGFNEGEEMEFVVTEAEGIYEVRGACSLGRNLIWTLPYRTRGNVAQRRSDLIGSLVSGTLFGIIFAAIFFFNLAGIRLTGWELVCEAFFIGFFLVFSVSVLVRRHFYDYSFEATKIFETFGFAKPENVNLPRMHRKADKAFRAKNVEEKGTGALLQFRYATPDISEM